MRDTPSSTSDRECLIAWRRERKMEALQPLVQRYAAFVHASAWRRTGSEMLPTEITLAVFLVFARRARKLSRKTVLAEWLFTITKLAARKTRPWRLGPWRWFTRRAKTPPDATLWARIAPKFDRELERLPRKQREAFLLRTVLGFDLSETARILRTRDRCAEKRTQRALKKLARKFRKLGCPDRDALAQEIAAHACPPVPAELEASIFASIAETLSRRPRQKLARRVLTSLAVKRWRRRVTIGVACAAVLIAAAGVMFWYVDSRTGFSRLITTFLEWSVRHEAKRIPGLAAPAKHWPTNTPQLAASSVQSAADIYRKTNIWLAHLKFSPEAWDALQPKRIAPLPNFKRKDGTVLLHNPEAQRSGLAGVLGFDFNWTHSDFEFGGMLFTNVATRLKGNGTFLSSLSGEKRAFKVDLNKFTKGQKLGGCDEFTFNNLVVDQSFVSDAMGYEFFRDAGVPAPRTAYAYVTLSVGGKWERKPLGLFAMIEPIDEKFAASRFGSKKAPIFKPVTYDLFKYLGDDWSAYADIYDLKTKATAEEQRRVIEFARLLSKGSDAEFAAHVGEFLDLDAFARFLAGQVILSNYDSLFSNGQNYYLYLDPRTDKFGFIPWDLDLAWGGFFLLGLTEERERASIWHPWVGENRFLERVMAVDDFRKIYRARLEDVLSRLFVRDRLFPRIDELASVIRPAIAAESDFRLARFDKAVSDHWQDPPPRGGSQGADRPVHQIKRFIEKRAYFVRQQLDGKSRGMILKRGGHE